MFELNKPPAKPPAPVFAGPVPVVGVVVVFDEGVVVAPPPKLPINCENILFIFCRFGLGAVVDEDDVVVVVLAEGGAVLDPC